MDAELHLGDGLMPVSPLGSGGQAYEVTRLHLGEYALEGHRRQMVTLVDNDVSVAGDEVPQRLAGSRMGRGFPARKPGNTRPRDAVREGGVG